MNQSGVVELICYVIRADGCRPSACNMGFRSTVRQESMPKKISQNQICQVLKNNEKKKKITMYICACNIYIYATYL